MIALLNKCELPHFSSLFLFQVVFISTPPGQDVPGDKTGKFHVEITLPISHSDMPDLRGAKELGHPLHPVFLQTQGTPLLPPHS